MIISQIRTLLYIVIKWYVKQASLEWLDTFKQKILHTGIHTSNSSTPGIYNPIIFTKKALRLKNADELNSRVSNMT